MRAHREWMQSGEAAESMTLAQLNAHIHTLISLESTESPLLSVYISLDGTPNGALRAVERRARAIREVLRDEDRESFEGALNKLRAFLAVGLQATTRGVAAFSRAGSRPFFLGLQFQVPVRNRLSFDSTPNICHLVEVKDRYHRYVVLIATESWTRILEINVGAMTRELWAVRPYLPNRVDPKWTQQTYQSHWRGRRKRFLRDTIDVLGELMGSGGHTHLILSGDPELTAQVRNHLPRHVAGKLVDVLTSSSSAGLRSAIAAARSRFIECERQESLDAVAQLVRGMRPGGLAVAGTGPTLLALRRGEANLLVMAKAYRSSRGWSCSACDLVTAGPVSPSGCLECGSMDVRPVNLKEEIVRLAERLSADVEFVSHSEVLMDLGGVGCLSRGVTSKSEAKSANEDHGMVSQRAGAHLAQVG